MCPMGGRKSVLLSRSLLCLMLAQYIVFTSLSLNSVHQFPVCLSEISNYMSLGSSFFSDFSLFKSEYVGIWFVSLQ